MMEERTTSRCPLHCGIVFIGDHMVGKGTLTNLSLSGCGVESTTILRKGVYLSISVALPNRERPLDIGLATVYRVLTQFEAAGLVTRHNFEGGHSVFELDDGDHHDHMVCVDTGDVIEFVSEEIERLQHEIAEKHGFDLIDHSLVLYVKNRGDAGD